jgi:sugar O-acyltransferase (sialic acid O-acetyltransferase NeuD family)
LKRIIIVGARADGHAKVVLEILQSQNKFEVAGFIDDNLYPKQSDVRGIPLIGIMDDVPGLMQKLKIEGGIVAIGNNTIRRQLALKLETFGLEIVNAIHPTVHLDSDVVIGKGNVLCQNVTIITGSRIGNCVNIHTGATIDHDNKVEDGSNIGPGVHAAGRVYIGKDAFIGTGASLIPDAWVGEGSIVGAGAVVLKRVEPYTMVFGVPARFVKKLTS